MIESPECCFCSNFSDNLEHFFYYCPITKQFWDSLKTWLTVLVPFKIELTVLEVLLGVVNIDRKYYSVVNYVILIGKYFICKSKKNNKDLFFQNFLKSLKYKINLELGAYISQDRTAAFKDRYGVLHEFLEEQIILKHEICVFSNVDFKVPNKLEKNLLEIYILCANVFC